MRTSDTSSASTNSCCVQTREYSTIIQHNHQLRPHPSSSSSELNGCSCLQGWREMTASSSMVFLAHIHNLVLSSQSVLLQLEKEKADTLAPHYWYGPPLSAGPFQAKTWLRVDRSLDIPGEEVITMSIAAWRPRKESEGKDDVMKRSSTVWRHGCRSAL